MSQQNLEDFWPQAESSVNAEMKVLRLTFASVFIYENRLFFFQTAIAQQKSAERSVLPDSLNIYDDADENH